MKHRTAICLHSLTRTARAHVVGEVAVKMTAETGSAAADTSILPVGVKPRDVCDRVRIGSYTPPILRRIRHSFAFEPH